MRTFLLLTLIGAVCWGQEAFGTWKMNPARSTFNSDPHPKEITWRIGRHTKGEVLTFDRIRANGEAATTSMILYLDGKQWNFEGDGCSGSQSSQRLDDRTIEIRLRCRNGRSVRVIRRVPEGRRDLSVEISELLPDGRHLEWRLVMEKQ
jgi:hypothetical protein